MYIYKDYLDAILKHYEQKKANSELSSRLLNPAPSKIREECTFIYQTKFEMRDLPMLRLFFGVSESSDMLRAIERFDIDKFRPLVNYLKKVTDNTDDKNIELLGWLLDFPKRPYDASYKYGGNAITTTISTAMAGGEDPVDEPADGGDSYESEPEKPRRTFPIRSFIQRIYAWLDRWRLGLRLGGIAVFGLIAALYFNNKAPTFGNVIPDKRECMTWTGDYYEQVSCDSTGIIGLVLPLDMNRLKNLRRITKPDTLTNKHIGRVWYRKRGRDSLDYFTVGGRDPVDPNGNLHLLSALIFDKYLGKGSSLDSNSNR